ncbi:hypothetical protein OSJ77_20065 [Phyllobacterium sp. 0TCS1.6C]|uniref:hypothetical protein n=1 Tax=unclassified Phyllobacterium TaxID=2638441 RepID=UPI00226529D3|nr:MULTISPECIES: hypothetical protein [unclassified Phyllobacterium]MCX8282491.1 hypothetical protein [Phyllobacterium sp. 0TCS1.6C]MCX8292583.1 hypothetical protein [Phyllobacterium sp. 0TCS1.6A]
MENEFYAKFNEDGIVAGFWQSAAYAPPADGEDRNSIIPADAIKITEAQFDELFNNPQTRKWQGGHVVPCEPPAPEPIIPDRVSRRQFRLQLIDAGLLDQVEGWIATQDIRTQAAYADSGSFVRTDEMLQQGFSALGFTELQVDEFFTAAAAL